MRTKAKLIAKGNVSDQMDLQIPSSGTTIKVKQQISYAPMHQAVQEIADPVSFQALKQFYNIGS